MGALTDFLAASRVQNDNQGAVAGVHRVIQRYFNIMQEVQSDPDYPSGFSEVDEIQIISTYTPTIGSGDFDLNFTLSNGETFSATGVAFDADAATIEAAIDAGATGNVTGWTNGDISVSGGPLTTVPLTLTFDGDSVSFKNHALCVIDGTNLVGAGAPGSVIATTEGNADEVQSIAVYDGTVDGGTFDLNFTLANEETFSATGVAFDADAATIEAAIDAGATGNVTGWTNGDISVSGGPLTTTPVVLTFDGDSVDDSDHPLVVIDGANLTGGGSAGLESTVDNGNRAEVQQIATYTPTIEGGTFDLDFELESAETFSAVNIPFDADAATIEAAIDAGADGNVSGWTNGDISVTGGDLNTAPVVLTFDGDSVIGKDHVLTIIDETNLVGGGTIGSVISTIHGQPNRMSWAIMKLINVIDSVPPQQGSLESIEITGNPLNMHLNPPREVLFALATQAEIDDNLPGLRDVILNGLRANGIAV